MYLLRIILVLISLTIISCTNKKEVEKSIIKSDFKENTVNQLYGINLNSHIIKETKIKRGDTFGKILEENGIDYPEVHKILDIIKNKVNIKKLRTGKPYTLFFSIYDINFPEFFVYHPRIEEYTIIHLKDSIYANKIFKEYKLAELETSGIIKSSLYETMKSNGINEALTYYLSDVYAWNIDFFRLQKGDKFKVIYIEKFIDDSISIGVERIKAAYFEHNKKPLYAFEFESDSIKGIVDYFNEKAKNLRRAFLKGPLKFNRISSRYNMRRRIAFYGNRIRPHKGTDFAGQVGTPILSTANGTVIKSSYSKANGNFVTIKHNNTYSTQYLHMRKRKVRVGQFVKQGDIIGWVGMTGYTSGPHVCYRFWKNGIQVDPFKQKLPEAKPISKKLKNKYLTHMEPYKIKLDAINYKEESLNSNVVNVEKKSIINDAS
jgi:murein DD-endopeptidase MepM/ murein hydrolase activator NlpD